MTGRRFERGHQIALWATRVGQSDVPGYARCRLAACVRMGGPGEVGGRSSCAGEL